jgi:hypothetical protein
MWWEAFRKKRLAPQDFSIPLTLQSKWQGIESMPRTPSLRSRMTWRRTTFRHSYHNVCVANISRQLSWHITLRSNISHCRKAIYNVPTGHLGGILRSLAPSGWHSGHIPIIIHFLWIFILFIPLYAEKYSPIKANVFDNILKLW